MEVEVLSICGHFVRHLKYFSFPKDAKMVSLTFSEDILELIFLQNHFVQIVLFFSFVFFFFILFLGGGGGDGVTPKICI